MAGSFVFGHVYHFLVPGPDNVFTLHHGAWVTAFQVSAVLLAVLQLTGRLVELALAGPAGRAPDVGGPEVRTMDDAVRAYLEVRGSRKKILPFPLPGKTARDPLRR